jgi:branched-chain amino acid transport system permease protein
MAEALQVIVDGLANGAIYASLALAIVLIFRSGGIANFAQGEMAMLSTYVAWQAYHLGIPLLLSIAIALAFAFVLGCGIQRLIIRPVQGASHLTIVIVTLGLFLAINNLAGWIWTFLLRDFPSPFPGGTEVIAGAHLSLRSLGTVAVLAVEVVAVHLLLQRTRLGLHIRATAANPESARLVGIRVGSVLMIGWGLASVIGAVSGVLVAPSLFLDPNLMFGVLIYAFAAAALGGLDSPGGAVVGGLVVGVSEALAQTYVSWIGADLKIVVPLVLIFVVLLVRPSGLFGSPEVARI